MSNEVVLRKRRIYQHMNFRNRHLSLPGGSMTIETSIVLLIYSPCNPPFIIQSCHVIIV